MKGEWGKLQAQNQRLLNNMYIKPFFCPHGDERKHKLINKFIFFNDLLLLTLSRGRSDYRDLCFSCPFFSLKMFYPSFFL